jgi:hypothetical protein
MALTIAAGRIVPMTAELPLGEACIWVGAITTAFAAKAASLDRASNAPDKAAMLTAWAIALFHLRDAAYLRLARPLACYWPKR